MNTIYIGYFGTRKNPESIQKLYAFQAVARAEGVGFYYFTPRRINLTDRTIHGLVYENGAWTEHLFPFPDVIYNESYPKYEWGQDVIDVLYQEIPRTSHSIGDKLTVYHKLKQSGKFGSSLIPSERANSLRQIVAHLQQYGDIVLKPLSGRQGIGVLRLKKRGQTYALQDRETQQVLTAAQVKQRLTDYLTDDELLVQPFIVSKSKRGNTYDLRLHVQKDGSGQWVVTSIYPRIAAERGVIPNLSGGGYTMMPKHFFTQEFGDDAQQMQEKLADFALRLSAHMDDIYHESFDELGIDVGVDRNRRIWIFELNWRPGPPPIWNVELDVARNAIHYAEFLAKRR